MKKKPWFLKAKRKFKSLKNEKHNALGKNIYVANILKFDGIEVYLELTWRTKAEENQTCLNHKTDYFYTIDFSEEDANHSHLDYDLVYRKYVNFENKRVYSTKFTSICTTRMFDVMDVGMRPSKDPFTFLPDEYSDYASIVFTYPEKLENSIDKHLIEYITNVTYGYVFPKKHMPNIINKLMMFV